MVVDGQVLDVTSFLSEHPGGELAILTFAGKDATEEFNMRLGEEKGILKSFKELLRRIHPPDVIGKYAPDSVIGMIGSGGGAAAGGPSLELVDAFGLWTMPSGCVHLLVRKSRCHLSEE